jgi:hypothetical protein
VRFFPYIMTLFMFILFANLLGLIPWAFTTTSHIAVTAVMALAVFLTVTALGFVLHGASFLKLFWISAAPLPLRPVLALIEVISYFVRPVSHSIRLAGNMMAGHAVAKVFAGFAGALGVGAVHPDPGGHRDLRARTAGGGDPGLCLHHPDLRLSEGRAAPASLSGRVRSGPSPANSNQGERHGRRYRHNGCLHRRGPGLPRHGRRRHRCGPRGRQLPRRRAAQPLGRPGRPRRCSSASPSPKRWGSSRSSSRFC